MQAEADQEPRETALTWFAAVVAAVDKLLTTSRQGRRTVRCRRARQAISLVPVDETVEDAEQSEREGDCQQYVLAFRLAERTLTLVDYAS